MKLHTCLQYKGVISGFGNKCIRQAELNIASLAELSAHLLTKMVATKGNLACIGVIVRSNANSRPESDCLLCALKLEMGAMVAIPLHHNRPSVKHNILLCMCM